MVSRHTAFFTAMAPVPRTLPPQITCPGNVRMNKECTVC